ncbi:hypothetical protein B0H66DRAFT_567739 [Apodospora peruviana]|uniref:Zn(2)-C6 fungal-type domain-containing protein n=1 Tax=Apodospora peruviana TaxID=516989 RepID=A0AAE0HY08_9PEZI|nr:hypothetical protein B0H66DRAFT_567739 [Apodospora peruviana]
MPETTASPSEEGLSANTESVGQNPSPSSRTPTVPALAVRYPRRPNKKSRTGCTTCKARKIKCDERHPACLNCISHGVKCPFMSIKKAALARGSSATNTPTPGNQPIVSSPSTEHQQPPLSATVPWQTSTAPTEPAPTPREQHRHDDHSETLHSSLPILELELLHNFTVSTYSTLAADADVCDFWRITVVREIGLKCDYIMRAVLAVSALHLAFRRPEKRDFYTAQGIELHRQASQSAVRFISLPDLGKDDTVNLFLFSMLTIYFALASPRRTLHDAADEDGTFSGIGETGFPDWTFLLNGAKSLSNVLGDRGHETVLAPFLAYGMRRWTAARELDESAASSNTLDPTRETSFSDWPVGSPRYAPETPPTYSNESITRLRELRRRITSSLQGHEQDQDQDQEVGSLMATYTHALDELELAFVANRDCNSDAPPPRDVLDAMLWLWEVSDSLVPLLKVPTQEAVAIFAHFGILLKHHESSNAWWLQGWAEHLIKRAHEILDQEHREWIEWPMREMGWAVAAGLPEEGMLRPDDARMRSILFMHVP